MGRPADNRLEFIRTQRGCPPKPEYPALPIYIFIPSREEEEQVGARSKSRWKHWLTILTIAAVAFWTAGAWAESTLKVGEVVVTATRTEEEAEKVPASVTVISEKEIRQSSAKTVQDILKEKQGIVARDLYGTGTKSTIDMRGFGRGLNTLVMIDGRRVNEIDLSGVDWNLIPLDNVERIEIVRGGGGVLYGDNAMAGAINIITKRGRPGRPEVELEGRLESFKGNMERFSVRGATDKLSYFVFGRHSETDGYRDNSAFNGNDISATLRANLTDVIFADFQGGYHEDKQGYPGGLTRSQMEQNRRQTLSPKDGAEYRQNFYGLTAGTATGKWADVELGFNAGSREFDSDIFGGVIKRDTDTSELKLKLTSRTSPFGMKNRLVAGIDRYSADVDNTSDFFGFTTLSDIEKSETGYYIEDELSLTEKFLLTLGYRVSKAVFEDSVSGASTGSGRRDYGENASKAALAYNYSEGAKGFVSYSKSFRLPTTDELFAFDGTIVSLSPETADTYEAGIVQPLGKRAKVNLTVYDMVIEDELFFNPTGGPFGFGANENIEETEHKGAEAGFSVGITDALELSGNWTYTKAAFASGAYQGKDIPLIPKHTANLNASISLPAGFGLTLRGNWVGKRYLENDVNNSLEQLDSYTTVDARMSYKYKKAEAYLGADNVLGEKYSEYGVTGSTTSLYYPAPERRIYGGLKLTI